MLHQQINRNAQTRRAMWIGTRSAAPDAGVHRLPPPRPAARLGRLLVERGALTREGLGRGLRLQRAGGGRLGEVLTAHGLAAPADVDAALAEQARVPMADFEAEPIPSDLGNPRHLDRYLALGVAPWRRLGGQTVWAVTDPSRAHHALALMGASPGALRAFAPRCAFEDALLRRFADQFAEDAAAQGPEALSARAPLARWQRTCLWAALAALAAAAALAPDLALFVAAAAILLMAGAAALLRVLGLVGALFAGRPHEDHAERTRRADGEPPMISVIIALYRESASLPTLVDALSRLDYPSDRLEAIFALEDDDEETRAALDRLALPRWARIVRVPPGRPRTKPRALNLALRLARGDIIGVYDAEDRPEPDQLRKVARAFDGAPAKLACVQARLAYYNARESWIARCFAIEYHMWFAVLLKGLADLGAPIPLGGTSMFVRRDALEAVGGWDAHNVTEDADLGMRLARAGYRCGVIDSTTWEEAAATPRPWVRQRSRWLKGFLQTWISQTRDMRDMSRRLGSARALVAQMILLVPPAAFLLQPLFWATTLFWLATGEFWVRDAFGWAPASLAALMAAEQAAVLAAALLALKRRRAWDLTTWTLALPLYWPMGALAAVKALVELVIAPSYWDKTPHGVGRIAGRARLRALARLQAAAP